MVLAILMEALYLQMFGTVVRDSDSKSMNGPTSWPPVNFASDSVSLGRRPLNGVSTSTTYKGTVHFLLIIDQALTPVVSCDWNEPGDYGTGFTSCKGDSGM